MRDPKTPGEWQEAFDLAAAYLQIHSAKAYGLVSGGPEVDVERCEEIVQKGRSMGLVVTPGSLDRLLSVMRMQN